MRSSYLSTYQLGKTKQTTTRSLQVVSYLRSTYPKFQWKLTSHKHTSFHWSSYAHEFHMFLSLDWSRPLGYIWWCILVWRIQLANVSFSIVLIVFLLNTARASLHPNHSIFYVHDDLMILTSCITSIMSCKHLRGSKRKWSIVGYFSFSNYS